MDCIGGRCGKKNLKGGRWAGINALILGENPMFGEWKNSKTPKKKIFYNFGGYLGVKIKNGQKFWGDLLSINAINFPKKGGILSTKMKKGLKKTKKKIFGPFGFFGGVRGKKPPPWLIATNFFN